MKITRRTFLGALGSATLAGAVRPVMAAAVAPKQIAIITTVWTYQSHAQHMGDRFLVGYPRHGRWHRSPLQVVSLYVDQTPDDDLSRRVANQHNVRLSPTVRDSLTLGGDKLAVDGVMLRADGDYPRNHKGQILYPRYEFFQQCVKVFEQDHRAVPIYNDKHLSYSWEKARKMVDDSKRLKFPFLAGSSLPVTWRLPPVEIPYGAKLDEALMVGVGGSDPMDYHALEAMQCMVERRQERDRDQVGAIDRGRCRLAGRRGRAVVETSARSGALTL